MKVRYFSLMALLATTLLYAPATSACNMNPTAIISAPAAASSHIHGTAVGFNGSTSTANCGTIIGYLWKNGSTTLSTSPTFNYTVTLAPEQVDSVITVSLKVTSSHNARTHTIYRTITIKRDHQSQYFVKDHLGSPRVVVDGKGTVLSYTDYYPFGMVMPGRAGNISLSNDRVKFTGYLLEEEGGQDTYHAEARGYDPVIGRFTSRDPITQVLNPMDLFKIHGGKHLWYSTYAYAFNNPVNLVDPDGMSPDCPNGDCTKMKQDAVAKAREFVAKNTTPDGSLYGKNGEKGGPGEITDCSGLVSNSIVAAGGTNPNFGTKDQNGVKNIVDNTAEVKTNDATAGDLIVFNDQKHVGIISDVQRNSEGQVTRIKFIHSGSSTGPTESAFTPGDGKHWDKIFNGVRSWVPNEQKPVTQTHGKYQL